MAEYIYGKNSVLEALKSERSINKIMVVKNLDEKFLGEVKRLAKVNGVIISSTDKIALDKMAEGVNHQGIMAEVPPFEYAEVSDILDLARERGEDPLVIILAEVTDPHNLGAVIRTAECAGVHGVIIPKRRAAAVTDVVAKVAAGAAEHMKVARVNNLTNEIKSLKEQGFWVAGADMAGVDNLWKSNLKGAMAIVMGSEGEGIPRLVKEQCDFTVQIPMRGEINSLNVSASAAIIIYEALRQRG